MCVWCWHRIIDSSELEPGRCPNCREAFDIQYVLRQKVTVQRHSASRKAHASRTALSDVVVQDRKLVSIRGLPQALFDMAPAGMSPTEVLYQHFLFGQYGRIVAAFACKGGADGTLNAVLRYLSTDSAATAVASTNGTTLMGSTLSAALIPTRYCSQFLLLRPCNKKFCWELHEEVTDKSLVRKDMAAGNLLPLGVVVSTTPDSRIPDVSSVPVVIDNMRRDLLKKLTKAGHAAASPGNVPVSGGTSPLLQASASPPPEVIPFLSGSPGVGMTSQEPWQQPHASPSPFETSAAQQRLVRQYLELNAWMAEYAKGGRKGPSGGAGRRRGGGGGRESLDASAQGGSAVKILPNGFPPCFAGLALPPNATERKRIQALLAPPEVSTPQ
jgi:hypothetical protein